MSNMGMRRKTTDVVKIDAKHEAIDDSHASRLTPHRVSSLMSRTQWPIARLGEVADLDLGKMLDQKKNKGIPRKYLANIDVRWGAFNFDNLKEMPFRDSELERYGLRYGDIVMCEGGEPGRCAIWKEQIPGMMYQKALHRIRPHDGLDFRFLYYHFLLLGRKNGFAGLFTGSTIKHMPKDKLALVEIPLPPLPVQRRIADILSAYDDLIENNRRRIAILEGTARRTYRKWFGGTEQGRSVTLGEIAPFVRGKVITQKNAVYGKVPVVAGGLDPAYFHNVANTGAPVITISGSGANAGFTRMHFKPIWASDCSWCDKSRAKCFYFAYCFLKDNADALRNLQQGAAQPHVYPKDINALEVVLPKSNGLLDDFEEALEPLFSQCGVLAEQNVVLALARDSLLPRLVSGEKLLKMDS